MVLEPNAMPKPLHLRPPKALNYFFIVIGCYPRNPLPACPLSRMASAFEEICGGSCHPCMCRGVFQEQRLRMDSEANVKWLKQVHQNMVSTQKKLVDELEVYVLFASPLLR